MPRWDPVLLLLLLQYSDTMGDAQSVVNCCAQPLPSVVSRQPADLSQRNCLNSQSLCEDTGACTTEPFRRPIILLQLLLLLRYSETMGVASVVIAWRSRCHRLALDSATV